MVSEQGATSNTLSWKYYTLDKDNHYQTLFCKVKNHVLKLQYNI